MSRPHSSRVRVAWSGGAIILPIVLLAGFVIGVMARYRPLQQHDQVASGSHSNEPSFRQDPLVVAVTPRPVLALSAVQRNFVTGLLRPPAEGKASNSFCLHWLRIHGLHGKAPTAPAPFRSGDEVLPLLLNSHAGAGYFGTSPMARTRDGFRFLLQNEALFRGASAESHRDHCLAALGELGVPSSSPVTVGDESLALEDALRDSVANFHLGQEEIEWTALAYTLYLPPRKEWRNRFGEQYTFDALATEMLGRPLGRSSCAGAHLFYAVAVLARADQEFDLLSPAVRERVRSWLERCLAELIRTQAADGAWSWDWHTALTAETSPQFRWPQYPTSSVHRVAITGHVLECFLRLPGPISPPDEVIRKAAEWLWAHLQEVAPQAVSESFCPYTHAICALRDVSTPPGR